MCPTFILRVGRPVVIAAHLLFIPLAYAAAFLVRFDGRVPPPFMDVLLGTLVWVMAIRFLTFGVFGVYRGWWRYTGTSELCGLARATTVSSVLILLFLFASGKLAGFPRSILFLDWALTLLLFAFVRLLVRALREGRLWPLRRTGHLTPTLIIGAGNAGARLAREIRRDRSATVLPVAFVDDDPSKRHMHIHGIPVAGTTRDLPRLVSEFDAKLIVIAIPSATSEQINEVVERCTVTGVAYKIVPTLEDLLQGRAQLSQLREVQIEDLLGRNAVELDLDCVAGEIGGSVVLITGGAGSIGSQLARQIAALRPKRLVLLEQAESPLYFIHLEILETHPDIEVVPVIADITDKARMAEVFSAHRPDIVLHAAAYKHVPMMEHNVREAVNNNVMGTLCVALNAARVGSKRFVLISTDKAVRPSSVMGATKRIAERLVLGWPALCESGTDFRAVRFGNVLGSDGSVIPLFKRQLAKGGPLTVTHPDVTRFFMTIPEACQLVLLASSLPEAAGRICMLEMGKPVKIVKLAENLIRLSGLDPKKDVQIKFTGLRPGEKLYEELSLAVEATVPTSAQKIRVVQTDETNGAWLEHAVDQLSAAVKAGDLQAMIHNIRTLVPECVPPLCERGVVPVALANVRLPILPLPPQAGIQTHAGDQPSTAPCNGKSRDLFQLADASDGRSEPVLSQTSD